MSKKKKVAPVVRPPTKRQLSRWQKQKRQQRIIFGIGMAIIAAVVILIGSGVFFGWYVPVQKPLGDVILEVGDTKFTVRYYIDSLKYQLEDYFEGALQGQWYYALYYTDYILDIIKNAEIMRQEAAKIGIVVSEEEIDFQLQGNRDIKKNALRDLVRSTLLIQKLTDEYFTPQLSLSYEQRQVLAMLLESQLQLDDVRAELAEGLDFGDLAEEKSLDKYTQSLRGDIGLRPQGVITYLFGSTAIGEAIFSQEVGTLGQYEDTEVSKNIGYWLVMVTDKDEEGIEVRISAILLSSEEEALMVKARLDDGEEFDDLAREFSQIWDEEKQADLGWRAIYDSSEIAVADYIFDEETELMVVSDPILDTTAETTGGYWLFDVQSSENLPLTGENLEIMINTLFTDWLTGVSEDAESRVTNYMDDDRAYWVVDYLTGALG